MRRLVWSGRIMNAAALQRGHGAERCVSRLEARRAGADQAGRICTKEFIVMTQHSKARITYFYVFLFCFQFSFEIQFSLSVFSVVLFIFILKTFLISLIYFSFSLSCFISRDRLKVADLFYVLFKIGWTLLQVIMMVSQRQYTGLHFFEWFPSGWKNKHFITLAKGILK